jgi:hypothetical protein
MQREQRTKLQETPPTAPSPEPAPGMAKWAVAKGRSVHIPLATKRVVGTRAVEVDGTPVYRDVTQAEFRVAGPGEIISEDSSVFTAAEISRMVGLGFLVAIDDKPKHGKAAAAVSRTAIENDPRVR